MVDPAGRQGSVDGKPRIGSFVTPRYFIHKPSVVPSGVIPEASLVSRLERVETQVLE